MNENEILKQKSNKGIIVILLIVIIGLVGFIAYDKINNKEVTNSGNKETKTSEVSKDNQIEENKNETITYNYSKLKGVYTFDYYELDLLDNGLYHYESTEYASTGGIGNYTIVGNEIHLNQLFHHGSDAALDVNFSTKVLKINSIDEIVDEDPSNFNPDNQTSITLKRDATREIFDYEKFIQNHGIFNNERQR